MEKINGREIVAAPVPDVLLRGVLQKKALTPDDIQTLLHESLHDLAEALQAQCAVLLTPQKNGAKVCVQALSFSSHAHQHDPAREQVFAERREQLEKMHLPLRNALCGRVFASGEPLVVPQTRNIADFYDPLEWAPDFMIHTALLAPLIDDGDVIGCLQLMNKRVDRKPAAFTKADLPAVQETARFAARLLQRLKDPNAQLNEREAAECVARLYQCRFVETPQLLAGDLPLVVSIGEEKVKRYQIFPMARLHDNYISAALANPADIETIGDFELSTGFKLGEKAVAPAGDIRQALLKVFPEECRASKVAASLAREFAGIQIPAAVLLDEEDENSALTVQLANSIIEDAYTQGASDIHVEPHDDKLIVRYRVDGVCRVALTMPPHVQRTLVARLKIMSELDIAEHRLPQDGRILYRNFNSKYDLDLRVSIAPMHLGESVVMRILDRTRSTLPLDRLGFSQHNLVLYRDLIKAPHGMILHCGPTGSGKSMTLFAALNEINSPEWKIMTAEDPVEYTLDGINQMQVRRDIGLTFAAALRCFLRQDPDIILVGEIRDQETAEIAIEAALTGHLLFSTLHTNDAASTITRLVDLDIERFLIASTLICVCAQRLLRCLCNCKRPIEATPDELAQLNSVNVALPGGKLYAAAGCDDCGHTGFRGRTGIHELLQITEETRIAINRGATADDLEAAARQAGMRSLFEDAMGKVAAGVSSMPEALATVQD